MIHVSMLSAMHQDSAYPCGLHNKLVLPHDDRQWLDCSTAGFGRYTDGFNTHSVASIHILDYNAYQRTFRLHCIDSAGTLCDEPSVRAHVLTDWLDSMHADPDDPAQRLYKIVPAHPSTWESVEFCGIFLLVLLLFWVVVRHV